jgi:hypothetical protein
MVKQAKSPDLVVRKDDDISEFDNNSLVTRQSPAICTHADGVSSFLTNKSSTDMVEPGNFFAAISGTTDESLNGWYAARTSMGGKISLVTCFL